MPTRRRALPFVLLIAAAAIYGGIFSVNKIAAEAGLPPIGYAFWQSLGAGVVLLVVSLVMRAPPGLGFAHLRAYLVIGALAIGLPTALLTYVAPNLPVSVLTLVLALSPPLTYLFGMAARIERFYWLGTAGILCGFGGVLVLVGPTAALPDSEMVGWFMMSLAAPAMFAGSNVSAALLRPPATTSVAMACGVLLGSSALLLVVMLATGQTYGFPDFPSSGDWALLIAIGINTVFVVLFLEIIRLSGPVFFAQFNYLAVFAGIAWGWAVFGESLNAMIWVAFALMIVGVLLISIKPRAAAESSGDQTG